MRSDEVLRSSGISPAAKRASTAVPGATVLRTTAAPPSGLPSTSTATGPVLRPVTMKAPSCPPPSSKVLPASIWRLELIVPAATGTAPAMANAKRPAATGNVVRRDSKDLCCI